MIENATRVLLIEDEPGDVCLVERSLAASQDPDERFQLESVSTLSDGLLWLNANAADVVLLDLHLPDSDGRKTLARLRESHPDVPVLVLTSSADHETVTRALRDGAESYFVKGECTEALLRRSLRCARERQRIRLENRRLHERLARDQKIESLRQMAGGIAHDFNNLLMVVLGNALPTPQSPPVDLCTQRRFEAIAQAATVASELTGQLVAFAGDGNLRFERIELSEHIRGIESLLRATVGRHVDLALCLDAEPTPAHADSSLLHQIVMNLVINAGEAIGDEPGALSITTGQIELREEELRCTVPGLDATPGRFCFIEVRDSGGGMDDEVLARIFDPFFTTKLPGRGLGLPVVLGATRDHGGALALSSERGVGTTVTVFLPAAQAAASDAADTSAPDLSGSETILVVDDDDAVREVIRYSLEGYGYTVFEANGGRQAIAEIRKHLDEVDLAVIDLTMPEMDGGETLAALRQARPGLDAILTTGYGDEESTRRCSEMGIAGVLRKPYGPAELAAAVKAALGSPAGRPFDA